MRSIFALFKAYEDAEEAVDEMMHNGFPLDEMNAITQDYVARAHLRDHLGGLGRKTTPVHGLDRLVGGKKTVNVSDVGRVFAAGRLATMLTRADCEPMHSCNGLKSALVGLEIPGDAAENYREGIKGGGILLFLRSADNRAPEAAGIIRTHKGEHIRSFAR